MKRTEKTQAILSSEMLRTSGTILSTQLAIARVIEKCAVAPLGVEPTIIDLLVRLDQAPENRLRAVELSKQLILSPSHISRMLDRAEAAGFVKRGPDPKDRRASQVILTKQGRGVIVRLKPLLSEVISRVIDDALSESEAEVLNDLLHRIRLLAREFADISS